LPASVQISRNSRMRSFTIYAIFTHVYVQYCT